MNKGVVKESLPGFEKTDQADVKAYTLPYENLYVYLLKGKMSGKDEVSLGNFFLGNWVEDDSSFLFFSRSSRRVIDELLSIRPELELIEDHHFTYEQWQGGGLEPIYIDNFLITPPWTDVETPEGVIRILLDPGVVFGNGLHPTTRDCLQALRLAKKQRVFKRVLDLGTGTGILALAAAFLGAERVIAVDINPLCVKTAGKNALLNGLGEIIQVFDGPAEDFIHEPADLVVANIHHEVIKRLIDSGLFNYIDGIVISGLMRSQFRDVKDQIERNKFQIIREWDHDMTWFTFLARNQAMGSSKNT